MDGLSGVAHRIYPPPLSQRHWRSKAVLPDRCRRWAQGKGHHPCRTANASFRRSSPWRPARTAIARRMPRIVIAMESPTKRRRGSTFLEMTLLCRRSPTAAFFRVTHGSNPSNFSRILASATPHEPAGPGRSVIQTIVMMVWMVRPTSPPTSVPFIRIYWRSRLTAFSIRSVIVSASQLLTVSDTSLTMLSP